MMGTYSRVAGFCSMALYVALNTTALYSQGDEHLSLIGHFEITEGVSDHWGYTDTTTGIDYALFGTFSGMSIIDATTDEANPVEVAFLPGTAAGTKDIKTWKSEFHIEPFPKYDNLATQRVIVALGSILGSILH